MSFFLSPFPHSLPPPFSLPLSLPTLFPSFLPPSLPFFLHSFLSFSSVWHQNYCRHNSLIMVSCVLLALHSILPLTSLLPLELLLSLLQLIYLLICLMILFNWLCWVINPTLALLLFLLYNNHLLKKLRKDKTGFQIPVNIFILPSDFPLRWAWRNLLYIVFPCVGWLVQSLHGFPLMWDVFILPSFWMVSLLDIESQEDRVLFWFSTFSPLGILKLLFHYIFCLA